MEVAQRAGEAVGLLVERTAVAEVAVGAVMAAGAAGGVVVYCRGLQGPEWGFPQKRAYHDVFLLLS